MYRVVILVVALLISAVAAHAQQSSNRQQSNNTQQSSKFENSGITTFNLEKPGIKPLAEGDAFISPKDSLLKLQRQAEFQLLPAGLSRPRRPSRRHSVRRRSVMRWPTTEI